MMMHLPHSQQEQCEKRAVVERQKAGAIVSAELFVFGQKHCRGEYDPVADKKVSAGPQTFLGMRQSPFAVMEETPERISGIGGRQTGEGKRRPTIANQKENRRQRQQKV